MGLQEDKFTYKAVKTHDRNEREHVKNVSSIDEEEACETSILNLDSRASTWRAVVNMTSFLLGVGALALPYAVFKGGVLTILGFPLFALVHWYTGTVMIDCVYDKNCDEITEHETIVGDDKTQIASKMISRVRDKYSELGKVLWPRYGGEILDALQSLDLSIFAVSYLISCGSLLAHALPKAGLTEAMWASIVAALVLPTTFLKDLACVAWQSLLSITSLITMVSVMTWYTVTHYSTINLTDLLFWDTEGSLVALSLVIYSYCVYPILIPIEESMADPSKFGSALGISLSLATIFKVLFSLCGFLSFSHATDEVIGNNFPLGAPRIIVSVVYVIYVIFSYTLAIFPVFQSLDDSRFASAVTSCIPFFIWSATTRFLFVFTTLFLAVVVPHFALLTAFVGSLVLPFLEYMVPCLVQLKLKWGELKLLQVAADGTIVVMGVLVTVFGAYFSGKALILKMTGQNIK
ncbi:vesicular inhibitory amino acid transporter-like [Montipora foliosa]|uniref:vesicular inhibitory amino acid transporter-like n=1 Tax=Montipora foliosa TaxID=591990 RepID=UPI0035F12B93